MTILAGETEGKSGALAKARDALDGTISEAKRFAAKIPKPGFPTPSETEEVRFSARGRMLSMTPKTKLLPVFGYPPDSILTQTNNMIYNSFPVATFLPCKPNVSYGHEIFVLQDYWDEYITLLSNHGYEYGGASSDKGIKVAFLADNFPTDSFTNEYGENFLQGIADTFSNITGSIAQISGQESASGVVGAALRSAAAATQAAGAAFGYKSEAEDLVKKTENFITGAKKGLEAAGQSLGGAGKLASKLLTTADRLLAGARMDFPSLWKSSAFQPSYSLTVRLYNPYPQSLEATNKYIIGPMVSLMLLAVPRTQDGSTYTWPFFQKISCPGIFDLNPGMITNLTIIKGGDQQQIAFQNSMGIVDVRIDIGSLYNTMVSSKFTDKVGGRPTVMSYKEIMLKQKTNVYDRNAIVNTTPVPDELTPKVPVQAEDSETRFLDGRYNSKPRTDSPAATPARTKTISDQLIDLLPSGFKIVAT